MHYEDIKKYYNLYLSGTSLNEIKKIYNIDDNTLRRYFKKYNLPLKYTGNPMNYPELRKKVSSSLQGHIFSEETKEKISATLKTKELKGPSKETILKLIKTRKENSKEINTKIKESLNKTFSDPEKKKDIVKRREDTCSKNLGVKNPSQSILIKEKTKNTNIINLGVPYAMQNEEVKKKAKISSDKKRQQMKETYEKTMLKRYKKKYSFEIPKIKEKITKKFMDIYGQPKPFMNKEYLKNVMQIAKDKYQVENVSQCPEINIKIRETKRKNQLKILIRRLEENNYSLLDEYRGTREYKNNQLKRIKYLIKHLTCGYEFYDDVVTVPKCPICFTNVIKEYKNELFYKKYIEDLTYIPFYKKREIINPKTQKKLELDLYNKEYKIAFECNGTYFHCSLKKDKNYHYIKHKLCRKNNIDLYQIWDYYNPEIVKSNINSIFNKNIIIKNSYNLEFKILDETEGKNFLNQYHIDGNIQSDTYMSLKENNDIISIMSFKLYKDTMELTRYCNRLNIKVIDGFTKLLEKSIEILKEKYSNILKIVVYSDKNWNPDYKKTIYFECGFKFLGERVKKLYLYKKKNKVFQTKPNIKEKIYPIYTSGVWKFEKEIP